ncbi:23S rRNA (uracil(1939)-C(5))-methyltransferase RlmD [Candidatus Stoquefichus massiliensis]|uniref:23S rRNA (uracil(1939)-C(5))-methyltransferase RlmD n=1 Tax=Candidatus Stoquefichus massiliensis TaxID=1470350 RepID=UPI0004AEBAD8|nr:23S rRNA (uracil(1939)-C(5))-methyltransferase RlmD [Candidatus Stoquefichus massiliensis]
MNCPISKRCGSCQYIHMDYPQQLIKKQDYCQKLFPQLNVHSVVGMENPYEYRNKVIVAFNQKYEYGLYEESSHKIVPMQKCLLHDEETHKVLAKIQSLFRKYRMSIYDEHKNRGFLKHVLIRRAIETNQTLVVLVATDGMFKGSKNFCQELVKACPSVQSVVLNVNKRQTSVVLSSIEKVLYGKGFIVDKLCALSFKISAQSFYQINHSQCEKLYAKVAELLNGQKDQVVLDTYCGIGTIGMSIAKNVKKVIGVELNKDAYKDALNNAKMNDIRNISFYNEDATIFMQKMAQSHMHIDSVIMDPPRAGSTKEFVEAIGILKPQSVVYVSCDPSTQARDLKWFQQIGYVTKDVYLYDMFPHTEHVETIVLLSHKSPESTINVKEEFGEGEGKVPLDLIAERAKKYQPKPKITYKMI